MLEVLLFLQNVHWSEWQSMFVVLWGRNFRRGISWSKLLSQQKFKWSSKTYFKMVLRFNHWIYGQLLYHMYSHRIYCQVWIIIYIYKTHSLYQTQCIHQHSLTSISWYLTGGSETIEIVLLMLSINLVRTKAVVYWMVPSEHLFT